MTNAWKKLTHVGTAGGGRSPPYFWPGIRASKVPVPYVIFYKGDTLSFYDLFTLITKSILAKVTKEATIRGRSVTIENQQIKQN